MLVGLKLSQTIFWFVKIDHCHLPGQMTGSQGQKGVKWPCKPRQNSGQSQQGNGSAIKDEQPGTGGAGADGVGIGSFIELRIFNYLAIGLALDEQGGD